MKKKTQLGIFVAIFILWILIMNMHFFGCASTTPKQELSPERQQAIQDSLKEVYIQEMARYYSFGDQHYRQGNYTRAKGHFLRVAIMDTMGIYDKTLYEALGTCYLQLKQADSAEWAYRLGIERVPTSPYPYKALAYIYRLDGRTEEAVPLYQKLTELEPDSTSNYNALGELYINLNESENAIKAYENVIKLNPSDKKAQDMLSKLYETQDIYAVISHRENMVKQFPDDMKVRKDLAQAYYKVGEYEKTIGQLEMVVSKTPDDFLSLEMLGESYKQTNQFNKAISSYNTILAANPNDKKNLCNVAIALASLGRYTTAIQNINKALSLDPQYGLAFITSGFTYETAADKCVADNEGKRTFDDKLVYKMAYDEYTKAQTFLDTQKEAERASNTLVNIIPTREDYFMNPNKTKPTSPCYNWID
ncbi:tetratricopeptide repeat protein [bacterium]|nr:tetratricopeptide repeat protein [bacterium]